MGRDMVINTFHDARSLDEFEINIVNLNSEAVWRNVRDGKGAINVENDLISLSSMIQNSSNTQIIIIFPQNINFSYYYYNGKYNKACELKNMLESIKKNILPSLYFPL